MGLMSAEVVDLLSSHPGWALLIPHPFWLSERKKSPYLPCLPLLAPHHLQECPYRVAGGPAKPNAVPFLHVIVVKKPLFFHPQHS